MPAPVVREGVIVVDGIRVYERHWQQTLDELRPRASFDFGCPPGQIRFTLFKRTGRAPTEVGAQGCGRRGMYVRAVGPGGTGPWVLNTEGGGANVPAPPPPPPPPPQPAST
ncbi:MAG: hypothetical protein ACOCXM_06520 [Myxococcota bacterium]